MCIYNKYLSTIPMAFRVRGIEVFSDDGALSKESIESSRDGSSSDITGSDELLLLDSDGGGDVMRVTVDELLQNSNNQLLAANGVRTNLIDINYFDLFYNVSLPSRQFTEVNANATLDTNQFGLISNWDMTNVGYVEIVTKWANSDFSRGIDKVTATFDGTTITVRDQLGTILDPLNNFRYEFFRPSSNGGAAPVIYYEQIGTALNVGVQNNGGPLMNSNINVSSIVDVIPPAPPAP